MRLLGELETEVGISFTFNYCANCNCPFQAIVAMFTDLYCHSSFAGCIFRLLMSESISESLATKEGISYTSLSFLAL